MLVWVDKPFLVSLQRPYYVDKPHPTGRMACEVYKAQDSGAYLPFGLA